jgi:hypothetical protein
VVGRTVTITKDTFHYQIGRRLIEKVEKSLAPIFALKYNLPDHWKFATYSVKEFQAISKALILMAHIHYTARLWAALHGCKSLGIANSILVLTRDQLIHRLVRFADINPTLASRFVEDLTFGNRGIAHPDPAIQPLIRLNQEQYGLMPSLLISSSMERKFICGWLQRKRLSCGTG